MIAPCWRIDKGLVIVHYISIYAVYIPTTLLEEIKSECGPLDIRKMKNMLPPHTHRQFMANTIAVIKKAMNNNNKIMET